MFGSSVYICIGIMIALGIVLPVAITIWWLIRKHERLTTVLLGAATWLAFAIMLESTIHSIVSLLFPSIFENTVTYVIYAALMAGIFEETGRFLVIKFLLKKRNNKETAISHGIGHGGFEALFIMAYSGIQYLVYAIMIDQGKLQAMIDEVAKAGVDTSSLEALPEQIAAIGPMSIGLGFLERCFAMLIHIGMSILVFYAVKKSKIGFFFLAIALHALFDVPAAIYQKGLISLPVIECFMAVYSVIFFVIVYKKLYNGYTTDEEVTTSA